MAKGSVPLDLILVITIFITVFAMVVIIGLTLVNNIEPSMASAGLNTTSLNQSSDALEIFNTGIPFIFFSFMIISIFLAWQLRTSPIVSVFMIMIISAVGYVAQGMSNAFYEFSRNSEMTTAANEMGYVVHLLDNYGIYILIIGIVIVIFMFAKPKSFEV